MGQFIRSPKSLGVDPANPNHWEHGSWDLLLHKGSQVPSMTLTPTWQHFLEVRLGTWPRSQHKSRECFCIEISEPNFNEYEPYCNGVLRLQNWDLTSMLGLGSWNPMWTHAQHFSERRLGTWRHSQHSSRECFCIEESKSNFNEYEPYWSGVLRLQSGELGLHVGSPCEAALSCSTAWRKCDVYYKVVSVDSF